MSQTASDVQNSASDAGAAFLSYFATLGPTAHLVGDVNPAFLETDIEHGYSERGRLTRPGQWQTKRAPVAALAVALCAHREGEKDGPAITPGGLIGGQRKKAATQFADILGLDVDCGVDFDELIRRVTDLELFAVLHTTHSHLRAYTDVKDSNFTAWCGRERVAADVDSMRRFLREVKGMLPAFAESASDMKREHLEDGVFFRVQHAPIPKARLFFVLLDRFTFADRGTLTEAHDQWKAMILQLGAELGVPVDEACTDPSRLFYLPRHPKGATHFRSAVVFGDPLDAESLLELVRKDQAPEASAPSPAHKPPKTQNRAELGSDHGTPETSSGASLKAWASRYSRRFEIVAALEHYAPDMVLSEAAGVGGMHIVCPFEHEHSTTGGEGTYAVNASDAKGGGGFRINCLHGSCKGARRDRLDHLSALLDAGTLPESALTDPAFLIEGEAAAPRLDAREIDSLIDKLEPKDHAGREVIICAIAALPYEIEREDLLGALKDRTKLGIAVLRRRVDALRREDDDDDSDRMADGHVTTLEDGHRVLHYTGDRPDQREARAFILETMQRANRAAPVWTANLGAIMHLERHHGRASFEMLRPEGFAAKVADACSFAEVIGDGEKLKTEVPDRTICSVVFNTAARDLPLQPQIRRAPTFSADGVLLDRDGHHGDVFVDLGALDLPPIPTKPTRRDVARARLLILRHLLTDFPFHDRDRDGRVTRKPSRANALAMLLTPYMRDLFSGPVPAFGIVKPSLATGGTLLAKLSALILDGAEAPPTTYEKSEAEMQKVIVSLAQGGASHVFFDDVQEFDSRVLLRTLTSAKVGGRILGLSQWMERPNDFIWQFTGNNPRVSDEMARRVCWVRLNALTPDNRARTYKHSNLEDWVRENRAKLIAAMLTLIRSWVEADKPEFSGDVLASFGGWSRAVGGVLEHAGIAGFLENKRAASADRDAVEVQHFAEAWAVRYGAELVTEADLYKWAVAAAEGMMQGRDEGERKRAFGLRLEGLDGRAFEITGERRVIECDADGWRLAVLPEVQPA